jgi:hypothetical protein
VLGEVTLHPLSQARLFVYRSHGKWVFPPLVWSFPPTATFTSFPAPDYWAMLLLLQPPCLFTAHMGSGSSLLSCGVFLPLPLSQAFPLLVAGCAPPLLLEPLRSAQLVYLLFREGFPSPNLRRLVHPKLFSACLYCSYCLLLSFSFFPEWRSVCPGGYADLAQACLWEYSGTAKLTLSTSSQAIWVRASGGLGALLFSPLM